MVTVVTTLVGGTDDGLEDDGLEDDGLDDGVEDGGSVVVEESVLAGSLVEVDVGGLVVGDDVGEELGGAEVGEEEGRSVVLDEVGAEEWSLVDEEVVDAMVELQDGCECGWNEGTDRPGLTKVRRMPKEKSQPKREVKWAEEYCRSWRKRLAG